MEMDYRIVKVWKKIKRFPRKPRIKQILKTLLTLLLIISWTLTGLPQIPFTNFPPEIQKVHAVAPTVQSVTGQIAGAVSSVTVSSVPGGTNQLYIAVGHFYASATVVPVGTNVISSISGGGLTWAYITGTRGEADRVVAPRTEMWWAYGSPATFNLVATLSATLTSTVGAHVAVARIDGALNAMPINGEYANTEGQNAVGDSTGTDTTTPSIIATVSNANSLILSSLLPRNNLISGITKDVDYTQKYGVENISGGDASTIVLYSRANPSTGTDTIAHTLSATRPWVMSVIEIKEAPSASVLTQNDFEWFEDQTTLTLTTIWGNPDIPENGDITAVPVSNNPPTVGDKIRLQINFTVSVANLAAAAQAFKLQFKTGTDQDCSTGTWTNVGAIGATTVAWRFFDNTSLTDGATQVNQISTSTAGAEGDYVESGPTQTNPNAVNIGQSSEWDFAIEPVSGQVSDATSYAFRMVKSDESVISYTAGDCPTLETEPGTGDLMRHGNFFVSGVEKGFFWAD